MRDFSKSLRGAEWPAVAAFTVLGAALRVWGLGFGLPYTEARPDETSIVRLALRVLNGDLNPHYFQYPSFFIYLLAAAAAIVSFAGQITGHWPSTAAFVEQMAADPSLMHLTGRVVSAVMGTLTIPAVYWLGRELGSRAVGLGAAALMAVMFLPVRESHFSTTDTTGTFFLTASVAALLSASRRQSMRGFAASGLLAGLAAATKYHGFYLAPLPLATWLISRVSRPPAPFVSLSQAMIHLGSLLAAFAVASPYVLIEFTAAKAAILYEARHVRTGHVHEGRTLIGGIGFVSHATVSLRYGLGLAAAGLAGVGAIACLRRYPWQSILLLGFPVIYYGVIGIGRSTFVRYALPLVPFACVCAAVGCDSLARFVASRVGLARVAVFGLLVVACAVEPAARGIRFDRLLSHTDSRVLAARWLSPRVQPGDGVYQAATRYARLQLEEMETEPQWRFDEARSRFVPDRREGRTRREGRQPIWVVLFDSPLGFYTDAPRQLSAHVRDRYELVWMIRTRRPDARVVMDPQDAFFVPLTGHGYLRPGPDIQIYRRR